MSSGLYYDHKRKKTTLALSNGQIVYRGYKPDMSADLMRTMLVLHNKRTGKIRMVQMERWHVTPVLNGAAVDDNIDKEENKIAMLNKQFGSKRVKRRTEQYERLQVDVETIKEQLEQTVSSKRLRFTIRLWNSIYHSMLYEG